MSFGRYLPPSWPEYRDNQPKCMSGVRTTTDALELLMLGVTVSGHDSAKLAFTIGAVVLANAPIRLIRKIRIKDFEAPAVLQPKRHELIISQSVRQMTANGGGYELWYSYEYCIRHWTNLFCFINVGGGGAVSCERSGVASAFGGTFPDFTHFRSVSKYMR